MISVGSFNIAAGNFGTLQEIANFIKKEELDIIGLQKSTV